MINRTIETVCSRNSYHCDRLAVFLCSVFNIQLLRRRVEDDTVIPDDDRIKAQQHCECLGIVISDPTKYFGCELGAQTQFDAKNDRYIVNGSHDAEKLQNLLDGFIKKFVLCDECSNPETNLVSACTFLRFSTGIHRFHLGCCIVQ